MTEPLEVICQLSPLIWTLAPFLGCGVRSFQGIYLTDVEFQYRDDFFQVASYSQL